MFVCGVEKLSCCLVFFVWWSNLVSGELTVNVPDDGIGPLMISTDDDELDSNTDFRHLMVFFDYQCLENEAGFELSIHDVQQVSNLH